MKEVRFNNTIITRFDANLEDSHQLTDFIKKLHSDYSAMLYMNDMFIGELKDINCYIDLYKEDKSETGYIYLLVSKSSKKSFRLLCNAISFTYKKDDFEGFDLIF